MVQVMVNPGRKVRDKVRGRDAVAGEVIEVRDVDRKILIHRGYVSDLGPAVPAGTPPKPEAAAPTPELAPPPAPVVAVARQASDDPPARPEQREPEPAEASEASPDSPSAEGDQAEANDTQPATRRRRYQRRDMTAEE